jgi:hypothetical protein
LSEFIPIASSADLEAVPGTERLPFGRPGDLERHRPDAHWALVGDDGTASAQASVWWNGTPTLPQGHRLAGRRIGVIGHYAAASDTAGSALLEHLCGELSAHGCTIAIGPMDGTTWRRYRFVTDRGAEPPFFLEPDNPPEYPGQWATAGFEPLVGYSSAATTDLLREDPRLPHVRERLAAEGVTLRPVDPARFDDDLRRIFALSLVSFSSNFLYTPISEEEFLGMYRAVQPYVRPELTGLAEHAGRAVGFLFAVPDWTQKTPDTVVIKTIAAQPGRMYAGLGALIAEDCQKTAAALGYRRAIHALMYDGNESRNISSHYGEPIRRYTLFARELTHD